MLVLDQLIKSSASSIPTEKRNKRLSTPVSIRISSGISACVCVARVGE